MAVDLIERPIDFLLKAFSDGDRVEWAGRKQLWNGIGAWISDYCVVSTSLTPHRQGILECYLRLQFTT